MDPTLYIGLPFDVYFVKCPGGQGSFTTLDLQTLGEARDLLSAEFFDIVLTSDTDRTKAAAEMILPEHFGVITPVKWLGRHSGIPVNKLFEKFVPEFEATVAAHTGTKKRKNLRTQGKINILVIATCSEIIRKYASSFCDDKHSKRACEARPLRDGDCLKVSTRWFPHTTAEMLHLFRK